MTEVLRPGVLAGVRWPSPMGPSRPALAHSAQTSSLTGEIDVLVWDGAGLGGRAGTRRGRGTRSSRPWRVDWAGSGLIVLIAPPPGDAHAEAARAGLENMARTLSIEWARRGIRPVAITPERRRARRRSPSSSPSSPRRQAPTTPGCRFDLGAADA